jgi:YaiO family outer membrane protein
MQLRVNHCLIFLIFAFSGISLTSSAQIKASDTLVIVTDTTDLDALFKKARELSFNDNYAQARRICLKILEKKPNYYDVRTFLARTYTWQKNYDMARTELSRVLIEKENDQEALSALFDVEFWTANYEVANDYLKIALSYYPNSEELLLKKAKLQMKLEDKGNAALTLRRILDFNPGNKEALQLMNSLEGKRLNNNFQTSYSVDEFAFGKNPQEFLSAQIGRNFTFGSLTMRINTANKFERRGFQYEVESYARFSKKIYANLFVGYAYDEIFPKEKYGAELYFKLPAGFEYSAGIRHQTFSESSSFYTTSLGNYYKDYWFNFRAYINPKSDSTFQSKSLKNTSLTMIVAARKYFSDGDNYLGIKLSRGKSPDESARIIDGIQVRSYSAGIEAQKSAFGRWVIKVDCSYSREPLRTRGLSGDIEDAFTIYTKRISTGITLKTVF